MDAWRNVEVNKGYQAIGVIRQKSNASNSNRISIIGMSKPSDRSEEHTEKKNESKNDMEEKSSIAHQRPFEFYRDTLRKHDEQDLERSSET